MKVLEDALVIVAQGQLVTRLDEKVIIDARVSEVVDDGRDEHDKGVELVHDVPKAWDSQEVPDSLDDVGSVEARVVGVRPGRFEAIVSLHAVEEGREHVLRHTQPLKQAEPHKQLVADVRKRPLVGVSAKLKDVKVPARHEAEALSDGAVPLLYRHGLR